VEAGEQENRAPTCNNWKLRRGKKGGMDDSTTQELKWIPIDKQKEYISYDFSKDRCRTWHIKATYRSTGTLRTCGTTRTWHRLHLFTIGVTLYPYILISSIQIARIQVSFWQMCPLSAVRYWPLCVVSVLWACCERVVSVCCLCVYKKGGRGTLSSSPLNEAQTRALIFVPGTRAMT